MDNQTYNKIKAKHPDWSEEQIWTAVSLDMESDRIIDNGGDDIDPNDENLIKQILIGAERWLEEVLPAIYKKVEDFFRRVISTIGDWIKRGIQYLKELIDIWF